ncbi:small ribosomal subunit protein mS35 [Lethenteron reissneri]|uniref:small ribosomal subunit protein mS35 n=1 Tax=Lethenteron reissneri TaxID=7753 RepID=UPI002AB79CC1|nr:small ribosomal subunit protein mS35 [Lethenteron reissneri]
MAASMLRRADRASPRRLLLLRLSPPPPHADISLPLRLLARGLAASSPPSSSSGSSSSSKRKSPFRKGGEGFSKGARQPEKWRLRLENATLRSERMKPDQDWSNVYATAASFKPAAVPLPLRMGYPLRNAAPPDKWGNLELIKVANFLHLTPPAIEKHCAALKEFCTEWPAGLDSDEKCEEYFPLEVKSTDYVSAGPSIRNANARVVTLSVRLSSLKLDDHARKKLVKLVGDRYDKATDVLTIRTERCPVRKQNHDYAMYLLTILYYESCKVEPWEAEKTDADQEEYVWEKSPSERNLSQLLSRIRQSRGNAEEEEEAAAPDDVESYRRTVTELKNLGDTEDRIAAYKDSVKRLLRLRAR